MSLSTDKPRRVWLRSFYGFDPEEEGYIGWTDETHRTRMLGLLEDGDLFMIYGAASGETEKRYRNRIIGFLQIEARPIDYRLRASPEALNIKRDRGWGDKWNHAVPVVRAWRADESVLLERIAPTTYRPEAGQAIAVWSSMLQPDEVDRALKIKVTEVSVFGEPPLPETALKQTMLGQVWSPSRAFPGSFGTRTSTYEDGPTLLYLARFDGDGHALLGRKKPIVNKSSLIKIGVTNDRARRTDELNLGIPPAAVGKWSIKLASQPYDGKAEAEVVEEMFKQKAAAKLESLGGEFFFGDWETAQSLFASIPGVARFGK